MFRMHALHVILLSIGTGMSAAAAVVCDKESSLARASHALDEALGFFRSHANAQLYNDSYAEVVAIHEDLERIRGRLQLVALGKC